MPNIPLLLLWYDNGPEKICWLHRKSCDVSYWFGYSTQSFRKTIYLVFIHRTNIYEIDKMNWYKSCYIIVSSIFGYVKEVETRINKFEVLCFWQGWINAKILGHLSYWICYNFFQINESHTIHIFVFIVNKQQNICKFMHAEVIQ